MYLDEKGTPKGFAVELFTHIMKKLDIPYEFRILNFEDMYAGLLSEEVDFFPSLLYSPERDEELYFAPYPVSTSWGALFISEKSSFEDIYDIRNQIVGVVKGDRNGDNFRQFIKDMDISCRVREYDNYNDLFDMVRKQEIMGGISSNHHQWQAKGIKQTTVVFHPESVFCVTGKNNPNRNTVNTIAANVQLLKADPGSQYYHLEAKWYFPANNELSFRLKAVIAGCFLLILIILSFIFFKNHHLRREVQHHVKERERERELERENRRKVELKNDFLSSVSHELRTPMNIITSLAYLLAQTDLDANQRDKINQINNASRLLLDIINNFLDFNRLEKGRVELEERSFSLRAELDDLLLLFSDEVDKKGLKFEYHIAEEIPSYLKGDPYRLSQLITNTVNNAIKFSERGTISFSAAIISRDESSCLIQFSIKDEGIGIDPAKKDKLFSPFTQIDSSITRQFGGSGLGLAICSELIQLMNGVIDVQSSPGEGTEIIFTIPFAIASDRENEARTSQKRLDLFEGARLLYVEDNRVNREIGKELFRMAGLEIETADNGRAALEMTERNRYDLILMDIQMPFMDGLTATKLIREREVNESREHLPIVALSAHFLDEDIRKARRAGMDDYLTKPISVEDLNELFHKWLDDFCVKTRKITLAGEEPRPPIPGIDMDDVMDRFGGNYELLLDSLGSFINDYALTPARLLSLDREGKSDSLLKLVHTLKGVLGSLGALKLFEEADDLENRLKKSGRSPAETQDFSHNLEDFINRLEGKI